jgi:SPP1 family predicted phage head-tail adaptor
MTGTELREWVCLFLPDVTADGAGGGYETIPAGLVYDRPAAVREISGDEVFAGDQTAQRVRFEITIRFDTGITTKHRVWWRGMYLDIDKCENVDMRDTFLKLRCMQMEAGTQ